MTKWLGGTDNSVLTPKEIFPVLRPFVLLRQTALLIHDSLILKDKTSDMINVIVAKNSDPFIQSWIECKTSYVKTLNQFHRFRQLLDAYEVEHWAKRLNREAEWHKAVLAINTIVTYENQTKSFLEVLPEIVGADGESKYTILFQNNMELRPTGGFIGSYMQVYFDHGVLKRKEIQDIYVPDGAIQGHVEPPLPIQQAFQLGEWRLRDSNWDPDFAHSAQIIAWFFEKGGVDTGDGIIALNMTVIEDILKIMGEITIPDYGQNITYETLYGTTQEAVESNFFPGSAQKRNFLSALTNNFFLYLLQLDESQKLRLVSVFDTHLKKKNIQMNFKDKTLEEWSKHQGWTGNITWGKANEGIEDYLLIVEANLGANKANCCIERTLTQSIRLQDSFLDEKLLLTYTNHSLVEKAKPPKFWGGTYKNYLRVIIPENATISGAMIGNKAVPEKDITFVSRHEQALQEIGFFISVPHMQTLPIEVSYHLPLVNTQTKPYSLTIQKQSGIPDYWHVVEWSDSDNSKQVKQLIDQDQIIKIK